MSPKTRSRRKQAETHDLLSSGDHGGASPRGVYPPFAALKAFEAIGRVGGIRRAAEILGLDHAVVSRHLRTLEEWAGVQLVCRMTRGGQMTREGEQFHKRITVALNEIAGASLELTRRRNENQLRIWSVPGFAFQWLTAKLDVFRETTTDIDLDIELHPTDASPDFLRADADIDIRFVYDWDRKADTHSVRLWEFARPAIIAVASPKFLETRPGKRRLQDIAHYPLLHEENFDQWQAWLRAQRVNTTSHLSGPRLWHAHLTVDAAIRGHGIALANPFLLQDHLRTGRLAMLTCEDAASPKAVLGGYILSARQDRWKTPLVSRFRRWLKQEVEKEAG